MLRPVGQFFVEPLEPRLFLSADPVTGGPVAPVQSPPGEPALLASLALNNGGSATTSLIAGSEIMPWEPYVLPGEGKVLTIQTQGTGTTVKATLVFPDSGYRVNGWGTVERQGNVFTVNALTEHRGGFVLCVITTVTHDYDLGVLTPGNYTFVFKAQGQTVETKDFAIDVTDGDWMSYVPVGDQATVIAQTQTSGTTTAKLTLTVGGTGYRVQDWGTVQRVGNTFFVDAKPQRDSSWPSCFCHKDVTHDYDLGALETGNYTFVFETWGHFVKSQQFTMTDNGAAQWVPYVPTAEQASLSRLTPAGGNTARVTLTLPDPGFRVTDWGTIERSGNRIYVMAQVEDWTGAVEADTTVSSHDYDLGVLTRGKYTFTFYAGERQVQSLDFIETEGACPVYRFWAPGNNAHFYTISEDEKNNLLANYPDYWKLEGVAFYAYPEGRQPAGSKPVYRFWSPVGQEHFYTTVTAERDNLVAKYSHYWTLEGVAFYVDPEDQPPAGSQPVYRFWSPANNLHFYTVSEAERENLIANYPDFWRPEGVAWHTLSLGSFGLTADSAMQSVSGSDDSYDTLLPNLPGMKPTSFDPASLAGQVIYLDFDGQRNVTYDGPVTVGPFDVPAFQTSGDLAGQEQAVVDLVLGRLQGMFVASGVIFTVDKPAEGADYSTVYIGGDGSLFAPYGAFIGLAERIDTGNRVRNDEAMVFADCLSSDSPDMAVLVDRLTGIIAHEAGHLLGYVHI